MYKLKNLYRMVFVSLLIVILSFSNIIYAENNISSNNEINVLDGYGNIVENSVINSDEEYVYDTLIFDENDLEVSSEPVKEPTVSSRAAVVIDRKTGRVLYEKNCNEIRKMASTTKIMTALVVIEDTPDLYQTVTVSKRAASVGGSVLGLRTNDKITINDLLYGLMLKSRK